MPTRRDITLALAGSLALPGLLRAQSPLDTLRERALGLPQLHAMLVRRGDDTLLEIAPRGPGLGRVANIKSCSKSVLSLLLGTAIARGEISNLNVTLAEVAPDLLPDDATEGAGDLTMRDLVTLRAGLASTSGGNYGSWVASSNWVSYVLRQPREAPNGGRMIYSTGTTHVLGAALARATGRSLLELARARLGEPLGIEIPPWTRDPQGFYFGGNQMALTPEGMLSIALLMRDGGRHDGTQVIDEAWIAASQEPVTRSPWSGLGYGYGWFLSDSGWTLARGYGGQVIAAHAERDLAVAITSDPTQPARSGGYFGELMALLEGPVSDLA